MVKVPQKTQKNTTLDTNVVSKKTTKVNRIRKITPRDSPLHRSSVYRGVTRHRWTGRYEAHLWDKNCWNESQSKKGRQVYLGAYDDEEAAAHAYDLAALKYWGQETTLNFPLSTYKEKIKEMEGQSREEYIGSLRRKSSGFSRGVSKYRGVARHHHNGRWEARIGRVLGNKYLYLGTYATQEEAAIAYDMAAIEYRGPNAVTNFDLSRYINPKPNPNCDNVELSSSTIGETTVSSPHSIGGGSATTSALGILLQSSKFKEMLKRTSAMECPPTPPALDPPRRIFPDDIQTFFDCQDSGGYKESTHDTIFGDLDSFAPPIFHCDLDG